MNFLSTLSKYDVRKQICPQENELVVLRSVQKHITSFIALALLFHYCLMFLLSSFFFNFCGITTPSSLAHKRVLRSGAPGS